MNRLPMFTYFSSCHGGQIMERRFCDQIKRFGANLVWSDRIFEKFAENEWELTN